MILLIKTTFQTDDHFAKVFGNNSTYIYTTLKKYFFPKFLSPVYIYFKKCYFSFLVNVWLLEKIYGTLVWHQNETTVKLDGITISYPFQNKLKWLGISNVQ